MSLPDQPSVTSPEPLRNEFVTPSEAKSASADRPSDESTVRLRQSSQAAVKIDAAAEGRPSGEERGRPAKKGSVMQRVTSVLSSNFKSEREARKEPTDLESFKAICTASVLNFLLICIPISWGLHFGLENNSTNDTIIFIFSFFAIIPLAKLLAWGTEELAERVGQTLGGLMNATLGNVVELIVGIIALAQCKIRVVQSSLIGSILSNILLVLGCCFFFGGTRYAEQGFIQSSAQLNVSLLVLSVTAILIPAAFHVAIQNIRSNDNPNFDSDEEADVLKMSHGVAFILLFIYVCTLVFQLWSHQHIFSESSDNPNAASPSTPYPVRPNKGKKRRMFKKKMHLVRDAPEKETDPENDDQNIARAETESAASEDEGHKLNIRASIIMLVVVTVLVAVTAEFLVSSIDGLTQTGNISEEWVGLILLPIVGNAAEHVTAVTVSVKDKLDLSIGVAVGSSIQISLFVVPLLVILGWILGKPLSLLFDPFESIVLFLAVLTVAFCISDGRSNWLEGVILMSLYVILAVSFWWYDPSTEGCSVNL